jgi:hypothetical protein
MPILRESLPLAALIPVARFHENDAPNVRRRFAMPAPIAGGMMPSR